MDDLLDLEYTCELFGKHATKWSLINQHKHIKDCDIPGWPNLDVLCGQQWLEPSLPTGEMQTTSRLRMCSTNPDVPCTHPQTTPGINVHVGVCQMLLVMI